MRILFASSVAIALLFFFVSSTLAVPPGTQALDAKTCTVFGRISRPLQCHPTWSPWARIVADKPTGFLRTNQTGYKQGGSTGIGIPFLQRNT